MCGPIGHSEDIDEGKSREIDVRAIRRVAHNEEKRLSAFIEIIGEMQEQLESACLRWTSQERRR